jgi:hypothetical protein
MDSERIDRHQMEFQLEFCVAEDQRVDSAQHCELCCKHPGLISQQGFDQPSGALSLRDLEPSLASEKGSSGRCINTVQIPERALKITNGRRRDDHHHWFAMREWLKHCLD